MLPQLHLTPLQVLKVDSRKTLKTQTEVDQAAQTTAVLRKLRLLHLLTLLSLSLYNRWC